MKTTTILLFVFLSTIVFAQNKQAQIWYFGERAGINFNTTPPTPLLDGQMYAAEGCTVLTDKFGDLIAYSDGDSVWNKSHEIMPNGILHGGGSPTQAAVFIPFPNHPNQYFLFTCMGEGRNAALRYNLLDATLNNGSGDIVSGMKDVVLHSPTTEQMTVISNSCKSIFWVVSFVVGSSINTSYLKIYKVDETGVDPNASIFPIDSQTFVSSVLKFTPNGKHLFWANADNDYIFGMADFNRETGKLTNRRAIKANSYLESPRWLEFSSDSRFIYSLGWGGVYQYDITNPTSAAILATQVKVGARGRFLQMQMQRGPDEKIYIQSARGSYLSVIHKPNQKGIACEFKADDFELGGREMDLSLPTICPSFLTNWEIITSNTCDVVQTFQLSGVDNSISVDWDFGDGTTITTTDKQTQHTYSNLGNYIINATVHTNHNTNCNSFEIAKKLTLKSCNQYISSSNTCLGDISTFTLVNANNIQSVSWNFGDNQTSTEFSPTHTYASAGKYTVTLVVVFTDNSTQKLTKELEVFNKPLPLTITH